MDANTKVNLVNIHGWRGYNNPWMLEEETDSEYSYINLLANPERYTGYKVPIPCSFKSLQGEGQLSLTLSVCTMKDADLVNET